MRGIESMRRKFLKISSIGVLALPWLVSSGRKIPKLFLPENALLEGFIDDEALVYELGKAYRRLVKKENEARELDHLIDVALENNTPGQDKNDLLQSILCKEFNSRNTVMISGWILPVTEARLYALKSFFITGK